MGIIHANDYIHSALFLLAFMQKSNFKGFSDVLPNVLDTDSDWLHVLVGVMEILYAIILFICLLAEKQCVIVSCFSVVQMVVTLIAHFLYGHSFGIIVSEEILCVVLSVVRMLAMSQCQ